MAARRRPRGNPALVSYRSGPSSVSVGDPTGLKGTLFLGALFVAAGVGVYLWLRSGTSGAPSTTAAQPVPAPAPVQPVPYNPAQPGY